MWYSLELSEPTQADFERDDIYRLTNELFAQIQQIEFNLKHLTTDINRKTGNTESADQTAEKSTLSTVNDDSRDISE